LSLSDALGLSDAVITDQNKQQVQTINGIA